MAKARRKSDGQIVIIKLIKDVFETPKRANPKTKESKISTTGNRDNEKVVEDQKEPFYT